MHHQRTILVVSVCAISLALIASIATTKFLAAAELPQANQPQPAQQPATAPTASPPPAQQPGTAPAASPPPAAATVLDNREASGILGRAVLSAANENMGRIIDVIVDQNGRVRAAIIDFGGFLGVGSRKIAVDWNALHFSPDKEHNRIILELTRDQVKAAPEYQEGKPIIVLGALAGSPGVRLTTSAMPEK
jgi:hypothetical protein